MPLIDYRVRGFIDRGASETSVCFTKGGPISLTAHADPEALFFFFRVRASLEPFLYCLIGKKS